MRDAQADIELRKRQTAWSEGRRLVAHLFQSVLDRCSPEHMAHVFAFYARTARNFRGIALEFTAEGLVEHLVGFFDSFCPKS